MEEEQKLSAGQMTVKFLKPGGCLLVIVLTALAMYLLMTAGRDPLDGYAPPQSMEYYASAPQELAQELDENVLPLIEGADFCEVIDGRVHIHLSGEGYAAARAAILQYYDIELFEFVVDTID